MISLWVILFLNKFELIYLNMIKSFQQLVFNVDNSN